MSVAFYHFTNGNKAFLPDGFVKDIGSVGWAGVEAFFVISGFVIPLALHRSGYRVRHFREFMFRRLARLEPPYLLSVVLAVGLMIATSRTPWFQGEPFTISWQRLLLHLGYFNDLADVPWYNDAYWTLGLELQFYVLLGIMFPLVSHTRNAIATAAIALLAAAGVIVHHDAVVLRWIFPFLMGIVVFRFRTGMFAHAWFLLFLGIMCAGTLQTLGPVAVIASGAAALTIAFVQLNRNTVLAFLGAISYSLYLVHIPIGGRIINLSMRLNLGAGGKIAAIACATAASIAVGTLLYRFVEVPAHRWARTFTWGRAGNPPLTQRTATGF